MSSWSVLCYQVRANFDGLTNAYCPRQPFKPASNGSAVYNQGKHATNVRELSERIQIEFKDSISKGSGSIMADLVIAADGSHSFMRSLLQPNPKFAYTDYTAW